jgi:hypothetical protein
VFDKRVEFAKTIVEHSQGLINLIDTKAGIILAVDGAILALLAGTTLTVTGLLGHVALVSTVIVIGLSAAAGFFTIIPRSVSGAPTTHMFYGSIMSKSREEHKSAFTPSPSDILQDYLDNVYTLALIQKKKFTYLNASLYCLIIGFVPLVVLVISQHI